MVVVTGGSTTKHAVFKFGQIWSVTRERNPDFVTNFWAGPARGHRLLVFTSPYLLGKMRK